MINLYKYMTSYKYNTDKIYNFNNNKQYISSIINNKASVIIKQYFQKAFISKPLFYYSNDDKITIYLLYYMPNKYKNKRNKRKLYNKLNNINSLGNYLYNECYPNKKLELRFIRIFYPYMDSYIFAQYIAYNSMKYRFNKIRKILYKRILYTKYNNNNTYNNLSYYKGYITGIKMLINGRLPSRRIRPRTTKYITSTGCFKHNSFNSLLDYNSYASKNSISAFSIKVWISQKLHMP